MIKTFKHKGLKLFFETGSTRGIQPEHSNRIQRILTLLNRASTIQDMGLPGMRLHEYQGNRKGTWSVNVSGNYRITFKFVEGDAYDINYEDPH